MNDCRLLRNFDPERIMASVSQASEDELSKVILFKAALKSTNANDKPLELQHFSGCYNDIFQAIDDGYLHCVTNLDVDDFIEACHRPIKLKGKQVELFLEMMENPPTVHPSLVDEINNFIPVRTFDL